MAIIFKSKGSFNKTEAFLRRIKDEEAFKILDEYGAKGVALLASATPTDTGETAHSWYYEIVHKHGHHAIIFHNSHVVDGRPIAILIQYGHGTGTGGFVQGRDYINPVIRPLFQQIADEVWKAVNK